jgi:endonuclease/exonuclease/phosphatase family metal-dependent hydrolase
MRKLAGWVAGIGTVAALLTGLASVQAEEWSPPALVASEVQQKAWPTLSVMTYNVEGLPFPVRLGRSTAAHRIADRLRNMREAGLQPHVVVLQEAFGEAQQAIGREAGYRYIAVGPDSRATNNEPMSAEDEDFAAQARFFKGERSGKVMGSGLVILSDYPIRSVRRTVFPAYACAGFDCLANKGVMLAMVDVPGVAQPVAVVATHMNSKTSSHVPEPRHRYAFLRQVATVSNFLKANLSPDTPYVLAGDTNIGKSSPRLAAFQAMLAGLPRSTDAGVIRTALDSCLSGTDDGCMISSPVEVRKSFAHNKDWEAFAPGAATSVALLGIDAPFGHDAKGRMLSDHIGYTAFYRLKPVETTSRTAGNQVLALR